MFDLNIYIYIQIFRNFDANAINLKLTSKALVSLSEHRVSTIRDLVKMLIVRIYLNFGSQTKPLFQGVKPIIVSFI